MDYYKKCEKRWEEIEKLESQLMQALKEYRSQEKEGESVLEEAFFIDLVDEITSFMSEAGISQKRQTCYAYLICNQLLSNYQKDYKGEYREKYIEEKLNMQKEKH